MPPPTHRLLSRAPQGGFALVAAIALVSAVALYLVVSGLNAEAIARQRELRTEQVLAQAREALLGRAVADPNRPGSLPCPDGDNDGVADLFAGTSCQSYVGRLPARTLDMPDLPDGHGERLWYVLSPAFRDHPAAQPINANSPAVLSLAAGPSDVAAIIVAPGPPLAGQTGRTSSALADYLEGENADGDDVFSGVQPSSNDRIALVTRADLMAQVGRRVLGEVAGRAGATRRGPSLLGYKDYNGGLFPPPDVDGDGISDLPAATAGRVPYQDLAFIDADGKTVAVSNALVGNGWFALATYAVSPARDQATIGLSTHVRTLP